MAASQDSFWNGMSLHLIAEQHSSHADSGLRRQTIEELLLSGPPRTAARSLAAYWRQERSPAAAHFVVGGFERLLPELALLDCRVAILRSFTVEPVIPLLRAAGFSAGLHLHLQLSDFNVYVQEIVDPQSRLYAWQPDVVILSLQTADVAPRLWERYNESTAEQRGGIIAETVGRYESWIEAFRSQSQAALIIHNLEVPSIPSRGLLDAQSLDGQQDAVAEINRQLRTIASKHTGVYVLDYDGLVARHGRSNWTDERKRLTISLPISTANLIHLCDEWMRFLHPITGRIVKAIVVDLDNTLWGGVLGEDGVAGIQVGREYPGAGYLQLQRALLDLRDRGILLAIASKNDAEEALDVLANHPDMLLRPDHFVARRINWQDKEQSLREIAAELNLGLDALAFLDDNPVERERIATELPEVTVIDLPDDPLAFGQALRDCPAFERLAVSEEDRRRGQYYADQKQREELQRSSNSPEDFFRSLRQVVEIAPVGPTTLVRVAQLTQKTNQFNLTTRRYSEQEVAALANREDVQVFAMRVKDVYNDNGIVGVAVLLHQDGRSEIETFLLSCRVIGRTVETAFLSFISEQAKAHGAARLIGRFVPTRKNTPAADFYSRHGFALTAQTEADSMHEFDLSSGSIPCPDWILIQ
jgi:FkbH-like protein